MRILFARFCLLGFFCACAVFGQLYAAYADPLMNREGKTLSVFVNNIETKTTPPKKIRDAKGSEAFETHWTGSAKEKDPLCFRLETHDGRLGTPERITVLIHEIRADRESQLWKSYETVPKTTEALSAFSSPQGFCPQEYLLTERLRFPALPPGEYVVRVAYWGVGNWDRQDIHFSVTE